MSQGNCFFPGGEGGRKWEERQEEEGEEEKEEKEVEKDKEEKIHNYNAVFCCNAIKLYSQLFFPVHNERRKKMRRGSRSRRRRRR